MAKRKDNLETDAAWNTLYSVTTDLFRAAPWGEYTADSFFSVCDENGDEYFLSFNNGVHCLPGVDSLRSYIRMLHNRDDELIKIALRSIAITRGKEGLEFKSFMPGYVPWTLADYEVEILTAIYRQALRLLEWVHSANPKMDFEKFESPTRRYDTELGDWVNEVRKLRLPPPTPKLIDPPDEMTLFRISQMHTIDALLELDVFTVLKQSTEEGYDRPFYPTMLILAEQSRNIVLDMKLIPPGQDIPEATIEMLIEFIEKHGRPTALFVQAQEVYAMLSGFCDEVKMPVKMAGFLSAVNFYKIEKGIDQ